MLNHFWQRVPSLQGVTRPKTITKYDPNVTHPAATCKGPISDTTDLGLVDEFRTVAEFARNVRGGDRLRIAVGLASYDGYVSQNYDLAGQLPKEFQQTFQPVNRARLIRVGFDPDRRNPPRLFAKTKLSAAGWPPDWLRRIILPQS
jgi:hypothetical protein